MTRHDMSGSSVAEIQRHFAEFAIDYADLPLYRRVAEAMSGSQHAELLLHAGAGQARPVLFFAALHDIVLRHDTPAGRWYASVVGVARVAQGDPWPDVEATIAAHQEQIERTIADRTTQTNEVNRSTYLAALLHHATRDLPERPLGLVELGASAGLLLALERYRIGIGDAQTGPVDAPVVCHAEDRSPTPLQTLMFPPVDARCGVDRSIVDLTDSESTRWLEACMWPDQPERLLRLRAAIKAVGAQPPDVIAGDMADSAQTAVDRVLDSAPEAHLVVMTSWALTYLDHDGRERVEHALATTAASGRPVSWVSAEPVGAVPGLARCGERPGTTVLGIRGWRGGVELAPQTIGTAHPHGQWVRLDGEDLAP